MNRFFLLLMALLAFTGCQLIPEKMHLQTVHNPFPQLAKVAVVPFINHSTEPKADGRQFADAYCNELAQTPGFEVVPMPVTDRSIRDHRIALDSPDDVRKLAQILDCDVVVLGIITDYSPYYPPRCGIHVQWYAANPGFHPIPAGYGLPWGTPQEKCIPKSVVEEAEFALAKEQLKTQTPEVTAATISSRAKKFAPDGKPEPREAESETETAEKKGPVKTANYDVPVLANGPAGDGPPETLPPEWPDPRGFLPPPPQPGRPPLVPTHEPVLTHSRTFNGHDPEFTNALRNYVFFRDDARFGGWQAYLQRSDDFIRFCCHQHLQEMLSARGGAGETRVVWKWSASR